ncbi:hypothetical protein ACFL9U_02615 [Thermodesulfobacteriota bacterium]
MTKKIAASIIILLLLTAGCPMSRDPIINSWKLWKFESSFVSLFHPKGTSRLALKSKVGLLSGNGNHCDFFVGELRTYSSEKEKIKNDYAGTLILNPISGRRQNIDILFIDDGIIPETRLPYDFDNLAGWNLPSDEKLKPMYLLYVFNSYEANADVRCH